MNQVEMFQREIERRDDEIARLRAAIFAYQKYNNIGNDLDAYLYEMGLWALGERDDRPRGVDFGLQGDGNE